MPRPLRDPARRTVRPLDPSSIRRKLAGEDRIPEDTLLTMAVGDLQADVEDKLMRLREVTNLEQRYAEERKKLRDEITPELVDSPRIFVGSDGRKRMAYNQVSEDTIVDAELLRQLVDEEIYQEVTKDKVDLKNFRTAVQTGRIPADVMVKVTSFRPKTAFVRFADYG